MKNIFISGVSSGIGHDAARYLLGKGLIVHGSYRKESDLQRLKIEFAEKIYLYRFDVLDKEAIQDCIVKLKSNLNGEDLDVLINNAGIAVPGALMDISDQDFEHQIHVNLIGVRNVTNAFLPLMGFGTQNKNRDKKIINISSVSGIFNTPFNGPYCISKHALESMNDVYRRELIPFGIDVIAVEPGPIKTKIWSKNLGVMKKYDDSVYQNVLGKADKMIMNAEKNALPVERVSQVIYRIIMKTKPKTRYLIHKKKWMFKILAHLLPDRLVDKLIWKNFKNNTYRPV